MATPALLATACVAKGQPVAAIVAQPSPDTAPQPKTATHTFVYVPNAGTEVKTVSVAGTFNSWNKDALPMTKDADGKTWRVTTSMAFGKQTYKFVVNGDKWLNDPAAKTEDDNGGNINSVLILMPPDYASPARADDGVLAASALEHTQTAPSLNYDRGQLTLAFRVRPGDARSIAAVVDGKPLPLEKQGEDELYARYRVCVPWDRKTDLSYAFEIADGAKTFRFGANGLTADAATAKPFTLKASEYKPFAVPGWVERSVFYQIFPDRFENGDTANDPKKREPWDGSPAWFNRFGGDVAGVEKRADHLVSLGVGAVYFNPVFQSPSNHRYDAEDFKKIDPEFGTNAEFARLTKSLEKRGVKTVMDFVFNHSATTFFAFQDIRDKAEASTYKDWYFVNSYPVNIGENPNYQAWYGFASMPKMNVMNPATHDYLLSLVDYWKKEVPLAGIRLDVANEVDQRFWRDLRVKVKALDPEMWIVGEVWGDGSPWLGGDQWDSVMNYQFRDACLRFFAEEKSTPTQFTSRLMALDASYAPQVSRNMMNLLSSHDTPRFLTLCKSNADMHKLAATLQFTWVGAPSIYYGEEIGMEGGGDPENRRGMEWQKATTTNPMLRYYKTLIATRNKSRALQSGDAHILTTSDTDGTLAFARTLDKDVAIVALNRSREPRTVTVSLANAPVAVQDALRTRGFTDALSGKRIVRKATSDTVTLTLAPLSGAVFVP